MPHPFTDHSVILSLNHTVPAVDYLVVGHLRRSGFRGAYYLTECYAVMRDAVSSGAIDPSSVSCLGELCLERDSVAFMRRTNERFEQLLKACTCRDGDHEDKQNKKNKQEEGV